MSHNYHKLLEEFKNITNKMWIKGINDYTNSVGLTFENLLGKKSDSMYFPDYRGIEIKCTQRFSHYPINLFSLSFDGPMLYQMNIILQKYGKVDYVYKDKKILMTTLSCNNKTLVNGKFYFKLELSKKEEKLYLEIYDLQNNLIKKEAYINFSTIRSRLELKLTMLALIWASKRNFEDGSYFRYYKIAIYKLKSFDKFIELLQKDIIQIDIICRVSRSGEEEGRQRNRNLIFRIKKEKIEELFKIIELYDYDSYSKFQIL